MKRSVAPFEFLFSTAQVRSQASCRLTACTTRSIAIHPGQGYEDRLADRYSSPDSQLAGLTGVRNDRGMMVGFQL